MKVQLQLSIEYSLKERLRNIHEQIGIPVSKIVSDLLQNHLREVEERLGVQPQLQVPVNVGEKKK